VLIFYFDRCLIEEAWFAMSPLFFAMPQAMLTVKKIMFYIVNIIVKIIPAPLSVSFVNDGNEPVVEDWKKSIWRLAKS
jgi:hypothetical protein